MQKFKAIVIAWINKPGRKQRFKENIIISPVVLGVIGLVIYGLKVGRKQSDPALAISFISLAVAVTTLFVTLIIKLVIKPVLSVRLFEKPPDFHKVVVERIAGKRHWEYYFALQIHNDGRIKAEHVRVKLVELQKMNTTSKVWEEEKQLTPDRLRWRLSFDPDYEPTIHPGTFEHCNIGYIIHPSIRHELPPGERERETIPGRKDDPKIKIFHLQIRIESNNRPHLLLPGLYRLKIEVSCSNGKKVNKEYELWFDDAWTDEEDGMLEKHIKISEVA